LLLILLGHFWVMFIRLTFFRIKNIF